MFYITPEFFFCWAFVFGCTNDSACKMPVLPSVAVPPQNLYLTISPPMCVPIHVLPIPWWVLGEGRQAKGEGRKDHGRTLSLVTEMDAANKTG